MRFKDRFLICSYFVFSSYCDHALSPELDECVKQLLSDLVRFQDKQHAKDPVKAKARRRYVIGLREVKKFLVVRKVTLLVLAPDLEASESRGGLNDLVSELRSLADASETPVVFTMNRRRLGRACVRKVQVSCVGVLNYQGSEVGGYCFFFLSEKSVAHCLPS